MKGYMLGLRAPEIKENTQVTWTVKKGGVEKGTYHPSISWADYFTVLPQKPTTRVVFWRSDYTEADSLNETYVIKCEYTDPDGNARTPTRTIKSRELNPDDPKVRDQKNTDTHMVQSAVIQIFGLDKGRLDQWEPGLYRKNGGNPSFYHSSLATRTNRNWSKIAEEIWNIDGFIIGTNPAANRSHTLMSRQVCAIWNQFQMILEAGDIGEVRLNDVDVAAAVATAGLVPPSMDFSAASIVKGICRKEGGGQNPYHSRTKHTPLAMNSVRVGEAAIGEGANKHVYTDWGIGFAAIQPYNADGKNLYKPNENLLRCATFFQSILASNKIRSMTLGPKAKVWYGCYGYNQGIGAIPIGGTPSSLRMDNDKGALYADGVFNYMGVTPPNSKVE